LQDPLQTRYTGGTVFHAFVGERLPSVRATKQLVRRIAETFRLPYYTLTPTFSICPDHGYTPGEAKSCPKCGAPTEVYSRVVGYLRPVEQWNDGKRAEFADRHAFAPDRITAM
jgi:ribonucleoside-triphosphate reductase